MSRNVALVETHALDQLEVHTEGLGLFHRHNAVFANLVDGLGNELTDLGIGGGDPCPLGDLALGLGLSRERLKAADGGLDGGVDTPAQHGGVGAGSDVAQALVDHCPRQDSRRRRAVTGYVVGLLGHLFDQLGTDLLEGVLELDLLRDGDAVIGNGRRPPLLLQNHIAALGAQGDAHRVSELVHPLFEAPAGLFVKSNQLGHRFSAPSVGLTGPAGPGLSLALTHVEC